MRGRLKNLTIDFRTHKPQALLELDDTPENAEKALRGELDIRVKPWREKRSLDANAYYWALLGKIAEATNISKPYTHNVMLRRYGQLEVINGENIYVTIPDTDEAAREIDEQEMYHLKPTSAIKEGKGDFNFRIYKMLRGSHTYDSKEMSVLIDGLVTEAKQLGIETLPENELRHMMELYARKRGEVNGSKGKVEAGITQHRQG